VKLSRQLESLQAVLGKGDAEARFRKKVALQIANEGVPFDAEDDGTTGPGGGRRMAELSLAPWFI
jgi:hypothetical protein